VRNRPDRGLHPFWFYDFDDDGYHRYALDYYVDDHGAIDHHPPTRD
jgi:hypothetical protein